MSDEESIGAGLRHSPRLAPLKIGEFVKCNVAGLRYSLLGFYNRLDIEGLAEIVGPVPFQRGLLSARQPRRRHPDDDVVDPSCRARHACAFFTIHHCLL